MSCFSIIIFEFPIDHYICLLYVNHGHFLLLFLLHMHEEAKNGLMLL